MPFVSNIPSFPFTPFDSTAVSMGFSGPFASYSWLLVTGDAPAARTIAY
jgi:hypothetical protein